MQDILAQVMDNPLYMAAAGFLGLVVFIFLIKKVFKLAMLALLSLLAYGGYIYMTEDNPMKVIQQKLNMGKSAVEELDDATKGLRREAIDKVIDDVDKRLKEAARKKR